MACEAFYWAGNLIYTSFTEILKNDKIFWGGGIYTYPDISEP
jgi:hypothetical protein